MVIGGSQTGKNEQINLALSDYLVVIQLSLFDAILRYALRICTFNPHRIVERLAEGLYLNHTTV